ncbi:MAG: potassium-transporting ATPase subunit C [Bacteroidales bacterium]
MKSDLKKSFRITLAFVLLFGVGYVLILWMFAQVATCNGGRADEELVAQKFTRSVYFWPRPSSVDYRADASGGSNKGPNNESYLWDIEARVDTFLFYHPYLSRDLVPAEMITASASGLDPDISPKSAYVQARRVAEARSLSQKQVIEIITQNTTKAFLCFLGPEKVNVQRLNKALDRSFPIKK